MRLSIYMHAIVKVNDYNYIIVTPVGFSAIRLAPLS